MDISDLDIIKQNKEGGHAHVRISENKDVLSPPGQRRVDEEPSFKELTVALEWYGYNIGFVVIVDIKDPGPGPYVYIWAEGYHLVPMSVGSLLLLVFFLGQKIVAKVEERQGSREGLFEAIYIMIPGSPPESRRVRPAQLLHVVTASKFGAGVVSAPLLRSQGDKASLHRPANVGK